MIPLQAVKPEERAAYWFCRGITRWLVSIGRDTDEMRRIAAKRFQCYFEHWTQTTVWNRGHEPEFVLIRLYNLGFELARAHWPVLSN